GEAATRVSSASVSLAMKTVCATAKSFQGESPSDTPTARLAGRWKNPRPCRTGSAQDEGADDVEQDEKDRRGNEAGRGEEAERHRDQQRDGGERHIFGEAEEKRIGLFVLGIVHLGAQFDGAVRGVVCHGRNSLRIAWFPADSENGTEGQWRARRP